MKLPNNQEAILKEIVNKIETEFKKEHREPWNNKDMRSMIVRGFQAGQEAEENIEALKNKIKGDGK